MRLRFCAPLVLLGLLAPGVASAQSIIRNPNSHPQGPELEPHLTFNPGLRRRYGAELGVGFRATFQIGQNNFISSINNSVGIGVGLDWLPYCGGRCNSSHVAIPVVMQWSFYLTRAWSVFAEPGLLADVDDGLDPYPMVQVGARWHFRDTVTLTMRVGWPYWSVGVSWM